MKVALSVVVFLVTSLVSMGGGEYLSPAALSLSADGKTAWVVQRTGKAVVRVALPDGKVMQAGALDREPSGLALSSDGKTLYVTAGRADGELLVVEADSLKVRERVPLGHTPISPRLSPDGRTLYVCNRMNDQIALIDTATYKVTATIPVVREPFDCDVTPDGKLLFVANHIPRGRADVDYVACKVSVIDTASKKVLKEVKLVNGAEGMRGIRVSPDGKYVYATHLMARFLVPTTQIERGWINTNALSVMRASDQQLLLTVLLDDVDMGFANPWGVLMSPDGNLLCVAAAGSHELSLIDLKALTVKVEAAAAAQADAPDQVHLAAHNDLSFLAGIRTRVQLKGNGPRAIAMHGNTIYATEYFTDSLGRVTLEDGRVSEVVSIPLGPEVPMTPERQGEMLFNDANLCFQKWQSCASCHPDVRTDGLNWDLLNDGMGNPKNVKSLVLSHQTPPVMALGVRAKAEVAVRAGIRHIQFAVRPEEDAEALDAYISGLRPDPSPFLVKGKLSKAAKRGKQVFEEAGCVLCHPAPLYTDLRSYDLGTGVGQDAGKPFDTPTLVELWRTSPYLHDGRAETLYEVITTHNPADVHGNTSELTEEKKRDLVAYVLSL